MPFAGIHACTKLESKKVKGIDMDSISIELDTPLITQGCASRIVRTIVELLLYNRTQIPFPYTTFRAMVKKLESAEPTDATHSVAELRIQKQREKAQHVVQCVEMLFDVSIKARSREKTPSLHSNTLDLHLFLLLLPDDRENTVQPSTDR